LIWPRDFSNRLTAWVNLRQQVCVLDSDTALNTINRWWLASPWCPYYLHWDDISDWPDPWQLLSDNIYCDVARGLGIMYTIAMLERDEFRDARLIDSDLGNLVQVGNGKYILNWSPTQILNTNLRVTKIKRGITQEQLLYKFK